MALFEIKPSLTASGTGAISTEETEIVKLGGPETSLSNAIGKIESGRGIHFVTNGSWALHDLLKYILKQTGPADVVGFTWSITVPAATMILKQKESGQIRSMSFIVDVKMSRWSIAAMTLLKNHSQKVFRATIHAKGFLIKNDKWSVSVIGSANFSNNPRIEAGYISTDGKAFAMHHEWTQRILSGKGALFVAEQPTLIPDAGQSKTLTLIRSKERDRPAFLSSGQSVFSDADFFQCENGACFSEHEVSKAAASCQNSTRDAMDDGADEITVVNPFDAEESIAPYRSMAKRYGYRVKIMMLEEQNV